MSIFSQLGVVILVIGSLVQLDLVGGNSVCGGIFEGDAGEVEFHRENSNVDFDDANGSSVCIWMIKLLRAGGAGVSLKLEDLDKNSVVNFYAEGEPTDPVNTPITRNSTQINSAVELSGKIFIVTLKSELNLDQFENYPTKLVLSWSRLEQFSNIESNTDSKVNGSKALPVEFTSTNYFTSGDGEKGRYNFKNFYPLQKSVWILDAGVGLGINGGGSLNAEVNVELDSSCLSKLKSSGKSGMSQKSLCECSYFGLFEIIPSTGKLRLAGEFCGRPGSLSLSKLSTQLVVFIYAGASNFGSGSGESAEIRWERSKETTSPTTTTTTTELPTTPEPPIEASACPVASTISPCTCRTDSSKTEIFCHGSMVNQTSIEKLFGEVRRANGIPEDRGVGVSQFSLGGTELTQLDLAPLYGSRMEYLFINYNYNLTQWVTSGNPRDHGSIHVDKFYLANILIHGDDYGDFFKYFSNTMTTFTAIEVTVNQNNNGDEGQSEFEFLAGLSAFTNLTSLVLSSCNISGSLYSLSFKDFPSLTQIYMRDNNIDGIGENVFYFDVLDRVDLEGNQLDENSFHPNSGITQTGRQTSLDLHSNQITTLPSEIFQPFLDAHPKNILWLSGNPLICDERLSWIKSGQEQFKKQLIGADCSNDPGHTIFNSTLIP